MRRAMTLLTMCVPALSVAACDTDQNTPGAGPTTPSASVTAGATPTPTGDLAADTKKVCDEIDKILDKDIEGFATNLGEMIVYKQSKNTSKAKKAEADAKEELLAIAAKVTAATAKAKDSEVVANGREAAANIEETAADQDFFDGIKALDDLDQLEDEIVTWVTPLAAHCR